MAELEYFPWYHSYLRKTAKLSDSELGRLVRALAEYSMTGKSQELNGREELAFEFIADDIDRAKQNYADKCERMSSNGAKGGRPTNNQMVLEEANGFSENQLVSGKANGFSESKKSQTKTKTKTKTKTETETKDKTNCTYTTSSSDAGMGEVMSAYLDRLGTFMSGTALEELKARYAEFGAEVLLHALNVAVDAGKLNWAYIRAILNRYATSGVKTLADVHRLDAEHERGKPKRMTAANYTGVEDVDMDALDALMSKI